MVTAPYTVLHDQACERGETTYLDPETGFVVFTRLGLLARDRCCGAGCRHCPFEHESVPVKNRAQRIRQAAWLTDQRPDRAKPAIVLFWSGGKDSYLAYLYLRRQTEDPIVLLTTFDVETRNIAHQEISIEHVVEQAQHLGLPLIGVPLHPDREYLDHIGPALELVPECKALAFGDLHLEPIRTWRLEAFAAYQPTTSLPLIFPLWGLDYSELVETLESSGADCVVSATDPTLSAIAVGQRFNREFMARLPSTADAFGENGEFHTRIVFADDTNA